MSSTIRVSAAGKRALEEVRTALARTTQRKVTQEEAAERAFQAVAKHPELVCDDDKWTPTKAQRDFMASFIGSIDDPDLQSSEIDNELYGPRA